MTVMSYFLADRCGDEQDSRIDRALCARRQHRHRGFRPRAQRDSAPSAIFVADGELLVRRSRRTTRARPARAARSASSSAASAMTFRSSSATSASRPRSSTRGWSRGSSMRSPSARAAGPRRISRHHPGHVGRTPLRSGRRRARARDLRRRRADHRARGRRAPLRGDLAARARPAPSPSTTSAAARSTPSSCARRTTAACGIVGEPLGIADFGGADFDDIVLRHVDRGRRPRPQPSWPPTPPRASRSSTLRRECVEAKEALSFDSEAVVPVLVGQAHTHRPPHARPSSRT